MKGIYKNPAFYYVLAPILVTIWLLLVWAVYLPRAENNWRDEKDQYKRAQVIITDILSIDPERLDFANSKDGAAEFDYAVAIEKVATQCKIPATSYRLSSGTITTSRGQKSQSAKVVLTQVDMVKFAQFLSTIQLRWANLQCGQVKLTKKKAPPDSWNVDLDFKYYY